MRCTFTCAWTARRPVTECLSESVRLMAGHRWRLFVLNLYITWKPLLAMVVLMGAAITAVVLFFAANAGGSEEPSPESFVALFAVLLPVGLIYIPVYYFMMRATMRAGVARVCFYDERLRLGDTAQVATRAVRPDADEDLL